MSGMNNLTTLIKRLEAATSRLEDIAHSVDKLDGVTAQPHDAQTTVAAVTPALVPHTPSSTSGSSTSRAPPTPSIPEEEDLPTSILDFDSLVHEDLKPFSDLSNQLGGLVQKQGAAFVDAFRSQRDILIVATKAKEPENMSPVFMDIIKDLRTKLELVQTIRDQNYKCPEENNLAMLSEGVGMLGWVMVKPKPDEHVNDILGGAQMYGNRVLTRWKSEDQNQVNWVRSFVKLAGSLRSYIKDHHNRGLSWNHGGIPAEQALKQVRSKSSSATTTASATPTPPAPSGPPTISAGGPPPPPPPPPPGMLDIPPPPGSGPQSAAGGDMGSVFADLNRGAAVTAGLKKVDKSQMTHKNPSLRAAAPEPPRSKSPAPNKKPESMRTKKPSRKELEGNKWAIENFENEQAPIQLTVEKNQAILITRCKAATVVVQGKANAISVDNCTRLNLVIDSLVSSLEVSNSANFKMQVTGTLPAIQLDKVDVGTIYLSEASLQADILTSKCTAINITLPPKGEQDDSIECPVPEQVRSRVNPTTYKLESEIVYAEG